jgi:hypothetical protein
MDDVGGGHALGADGSREALAKLAIGNRGESVHEYWHITGIFGLAADTQGALRASERVASRRARETRSASIVARWRRGQRPAGRSASACRLPVRQHEST